MVEWGTLLRCCARKGTEGSNPSLSANKNDPNCFGSFLLVDRKGRDSKAGGDVHEVHRRGQARALSERSRVSAERFYATSET